MKCMPVLHRALGLLSRTNTYASKGDTPRVHMLARSPVFLVFTYHSAYWGLRESQTEGLVERK